jgi:hypothetical protein
MSHLRPALAQLCDHPNLLRLGGDVRLKLTDALLLPLNLQLQPPANSEAGDHSGLWPTLVQHL